MAIVYAHWATAVRLRLGWLVGMVMLGSHADPTGVGLAGLQLRLGHLPRRCLLWWLRSADGALPLAELCANSATFGVLRLVSFGVKLLTRRASGRVRISVICHYGCSSLLDG